MAKVGGCHLTAEDSGGTSSNIVWCADLPRHCDRLVALTKAGLGPTLGAIIGVLKVHGNGNVGDSPPANMLEHCLRLMPNLRWLQVDRVPLAKLAPAIGSCDDLSKLLHLTVSCECTSAVVALMYCTDALLIGPDSVGEGGGEQFGAALSRATNLRALHLTGRELDSACVHFCGALTIP